MWIVRYRNIVYSIIGIIMILSVMAIAVWGLRPSIEFTGGSLIEVNYPSGRPDKTALESALAPHIRNEHSLRGSGTNGYLLRTRTLSGDEYTEVEDALALNGQIRDMTIVRTAAVGPTIGTELKNKAAVAIAIVVCLIGLYIAFAFRKVSKPVSSSWYGLITIIVLLHDVIVPAGVFAAAGHFFGAEIDVLFITALLTILGYSVNDTIVVFDRIREHLRINEDNNVSQPFDGLVGDAIIQTLGRSFNTSFTVLLVVIALLVLGGSTTTFFAMTLTIGVIAGTYSSILLASPLLVSIERYQAARSTAVMSIGKSSKKSLAKQNISK